MVFDRISFKARSRRGSISSWTYSNKRCGKPTERNRNLPPPQESRCPWVNKGGAYVGPVPPLLVYTERARPSLEILGVQIGSIPHTNRKTRTSSCEHVNSSFTVYKIPHLRGKGSNRKNREGISPRFFLATDLRFGYGMPGLIQPDLAVAALRSIILIKVFVFFPLFYDCPNVGSDIRIKRDWVTYGCRCTTTFYRPRCLRDIRAVGPSPLSSVASNTFGQRKPLHGLI